MIELFPAFPENRPPRLLLIGAHADDIEIGCAGTVIQLVEAHSDAQVHWVVLSSEGPRKKEAEDAARELLAPLPDPRVTILDFRGAYFPAELARIKDFFETLKDSAPDVIFTHCRDELHQDHRVVGELTWNTFRDHLILEYEIPKYDGGLGSPSVFVPLAEAVVQRKIDLLMRAFESQRDKRWFTPETFLGLMRIRGIECNAPDGYAEAYTSRKLVLGAG